MPLPEWRSILLVNSRYFKHMVFFNLSFIDNDNLTSPDFHGKDLSMYLYNSPSTTDAWEEGFYGKTTE